MKRICVHAQRILYCKDNVGTGSEFMTIPCGTVSITCWSRTHSTTAASSGGCRAYCSCTLR